MTRVEQFVGNKEVLHSNASFVGRLKTSPNDWKPRNFIGMRVPLPFIGKSVRNRLTHGGPPSHDSPLAHTMRVTIWAFSQQRSLQRSVTADRNMGNKQKCIISDWIFQLIALHEKNERFSWIICLDCTPTYCFVTSTELKITVTACNSICKLHIFCSWHNSRSTVSAKEREITVRSKSLCNTQEIIILTLDQCVFHYINRYVVYSRELREGDNHFRSHFQLLFGISHITFSINVTIKASRISQCFLLL